MFKPHNMYRFKVNRDVGFEVLTSFYVKERDRWSLKVAWVNIGKCHQPWLMGITQRLTITAEQMQGIERIKSDFRVPVTEYDPVYY